MFPEFRELISRLKTEDLHFKHLFDKHNDLDQKIKNLEDHVNHVHLRQEEIERMKKEKLHLKDQIYQVLLRHRAESQLQGP